jgi:hypothetical protein
MSQVPKDTSEAPRERPWQIMLTGSGLEAIDAAARQALEQILELFTEVGGLVVQTTAGDVSVTRDFPSDYTIQVDRLLKEIFKNSSAVTGIKCLGSENPPRKMRDSRIIGRNPPKPTLSRCALTTPNLPPIMGKCGNPLGIGARLQATVA